MQVLAAVVLFASAADSSAQGLRLSPDAEVRSVHVRFSGPHELIEQDVLDQVATVAPGPVRGIQAAFAWIPFVQDPHRHPFDPVVLQQDVVRLRRYCRRQGFLEASVDYEVAVDRNRRFVDVTFLVEEGSALRLRSLTLTGPDSSPLILATDQSQEDMRKAWTRTRAQYVGRRFREQEITSLELRLNEFLANQGYAHATIKPLAAIDSVSGHVDLVWHVAPGVRSRFGAIEIQGTKSVPERTVERQLGFEAGEWTSRRALERGRANVLTVALFRRADLTLGPGSPGDSALPVKIAVSEDRHRFTTIEAGYVTDGAGISGQVRWTHPNFTGGARSLNAIGLFQSGWGATSEIKDRLAKVTLALNQPYVGAPNLSLSAGPSYEYRDGHVDKSTAWSVQSTLVWRFNALQSAALRYEFTDRQVDLSRSHDLATDTQSIRTLRAFGTDALIDSLAAPVLTSLWSLSTSLGGLDDIARPQRGLVLKPNLSVTSPRALGTVEFSRADVQLTAFAPMPGRSNAIMFRGNVGGVWPFGKSLPGPNESPVVELVRLRDYVLTAGGANDVRGYASRMLGPKTLRVEGTVSDGDTILTSDRYLEIGGLRRWTATLELRLGMPWVSRDVFAHVFGDAGRVWTSDPRFVLSQVTPDEQRVFFTTGGGLGYYTPVGAIRFDVGYKLNPSVLDLRNPQDVLDALLAGQPASTARINEWRRLAFHIALGLYF